VVAPPAYLLLLAYRALDAPVWLPDGALPPSTVVWLLLLLVGCCGCFSGLVAAPHGGGRQRGGGTEAAICGARIEAVAPRALERRVRYLSSRFASHAPRWQLVIWLRQLSLLVLVTASKLAMSRASSEEQRFVVRYATAGGALALLALAWCVHRRHDPYALRMQNALESWLYASNVLLLLLALAYTALVQHQAAPSLDVRRALEAAMLVALVSGCAIAAVYVVRSVLVASAGAGAVAQHF